MALETYYEQELEDFAYLLIDEAVREVIERAAETGQDISMPSDVERDKLMRAGAAALVDVWTHPSFDDYRRTENSYMPSARDEKRSLERVRLWSGTHHVSMHDAMYYVMYAASATILNTALGNSLIAGGFSWIIDWAVQKISDSWGKRSGIVRVEEADQPIACAAINLSCGNPFGISKKPEAVTSHDVADELALVGFFSEEGSCSHSSIVFPDVLISDQQIVGIRPLLSFERCPVALSQEKRVEYVDKSLKNLVKLGVFKPEDEQSYRYCS